MSPPSPHDASGRAPVPAPPPAADGAAGLLAQLRHLEETERRLRETTAVLEDTSRLARVGGWTYEVDSGQLHWTEEVFRMHEVGPDFVPDVAGAIAFYHPDDRPRIAAAVESSLRDGSTWDLELRLVTARGRELWIRAQGHATRRDGRTVRVSGAIQDIDELHRAREAARRSETALRDLIGTIDGIVWEADPDDLTFLFVSPQAERLLGYPVRRWLEEPGFWAAQIHPEDRAAAVAYCRDETAAGRDHVFEYRLIAADGREVRIRDSVSMARARDGRRVLRGLMVDVTARERTAEALRQAEGRWRFALEGAGDGVWDWDLASGRVFYSRQWKAMLGFGEDEVADTLDEWRRLVHPDDAAGVLAKVDAALGETPATITTEFRMRTKAGAWKWVRSRGKVLERGPGGEPVRVIGIHTDIDGERTRAALLRETTLQLELALRASELGVFRRCQTTGEFTRWNDRMWAIAGRPPAAAPPPLATLLAWVDPRDHAAVRTGVEAMRRGGSVRNLSFRLQRPDGTVRHCLLSSDAVRDGEGAFAHSAGVVRDVTEQATAEAALHAANEQMRLALRASQFGVWEVDLATERLDWDDQLHAVYGFAPGAFDGTVATWRACLHPDDRGPVDSAFAGLLDGRPVDYLEFRIRRRSDGRERLVEANGVLLRDPAGRPLRAVGMNRDITEQREHETEYRRANERLQTAVVASKLVWWEWRVDRGDFRLNACGADCILGYTAAELAGVDSDGWLDRVHPDERAAVAATLRQAIAGELPTWVAEHRLRDAAGEWRWVRNIGRVSERDGAGRPRLMLGTTQDIHDRRLSEERAERTAARLELALRTARLGVWRRDLVTGEAEWDDRLREIHRLPAGRPLPTLAQFLERIAPEDRAAYAAGLAAVAGDQPGFSLEFGFEAFDGTPIRVRVVARAERDRSGRTTALSGVTEDITERHRAQMRERDLAAQLQQSQRLETLGTLAGGIAHDFNNLLTGILGFIDLALVEGGDGRGAEPLLRKARQGAINARDLVKRLLLFARRAPPAPQETVDLARFIPESVPLLAAALPASIALETDLCPGPVPVSADRGQWQQILMNLCVNAAHAIGARQGRVVIALRRPEPGPGAPARVELSVTDDGCGMDEATKARIFDPFFTTRPVGEGTGLGLSIVHGLVQEHRGTIEVDSRPGRGTTFRFTLPLAEDAPRPGSASPFPAGQPWSVAAGRVLLADDDEAVRAFAATALRRFGFEVEEFRDGQAAAAAVADPGREFALAVIDLSMPGLTGWELVAVIRRYRPALPVVVASGDLRRYGLHPAAQDQRLSTLGKPFSLEELRECARRALAGPPAP